MSDPAATLDLVLEELRALRAEVRELRQERRQSWGGLLNTEEAAALLCVTPTALVKRAQRGLVPAERFGRQYRFRRRDVLALVGPGVAK